MIGCWPRPTYGVRLSALFGALFLIYGVQLTYLPVWLNARGLSAPLIAFATSAPLFLRLVFTPAVAVLADRSAAHRLVIILLGWSGFWLLLAMSQARSEAMLVALVVLVLMTLQTIMPLTDTIAVKAVRTHGVDYGGMRLWGSLTFILATLAAGLLVDVQGPEVVLWMLAAATLTTVLVAHILPLSVPTPEGEAAPKLSGRVVLGLLSDRRFLLFVLASSGIQASHAMFYVFGVLHWRTLGFNSAVIGFLWAVGVVAEIGLFWASRRATTRLGPIALIVIGGVAGVVRWTLMAVDPPFLALVGLQALHALTYAATHLGAMQYIGSMVAEDKQGSAQALLSTFTAGIAMGAAILIAGVTYARFAGAGYLVMAMISAAGIAAALALGRFCVGNAKSAAHP